MMMTWYQTKQLIDESAQDIKTYIADDFTYKQTAAATLERIWPTGRYRWLSTWAALAIRLEPARAR